MSKRAKIILAVVILAVVVGVAGVFAIGSRGAGPEVETSTVAKQDLAVTVAASGKVESGVSADLFPPTAGTLEQILVKDGQKVSAGDEIAVMDTAPIELQVAQARAGLSQARAALANIEAQGGGSADVKAAKAQVAAAYQAYVAAKAALASIGAQAPSQDQIDAAKAAASAAKNAYDGALAAYTAYPSNDATKAALGAAKDQAYAGYLQAKAALSAMQNTDLSAAKAQAQAGVDQAYAAWQGAKAALERVRNADPASQKAAALQAVRQATEGLALAERTLEDATFAAPIDGVVIFNPAGGIQGGPTATEGSAVSPASAPFSVVDLGALKFTAEVDEADVERVKAGMKASVTLDSFAGEQFPTAVARINPAAQPTATGGTVFAVELPLNDTGKDVLIGMKGDATIEVSSQGSALTVPVEALFTEGGTDYVYVVEDNKLKKVEVTVGATTDTEDEILEGLTEGQVVALSGSTQYTDGMPVRIKK